MSNKPTKHEQQPAKMSTDDSYMYDTHVDDVMLESGAQVLGAGVLADGLEQTHVADADGGVEGVHEPAAPPTAAQAAAASRHHAAAACRSLARSLVHSSTRVSTRVCDVTDSFGLLLGE